jgi:hypothetical protein
MSVIPRLLFDMSPLGGGIGIFAGVVFFFVLLAVAFIAFKLLKRTVKMAFRMAIAGIIVLIAIAGSIAFFWLGSSKPSRPQPRPAAAQPK